MTLPREVPPDLSVKLSKKNEFWAGSSIYQKLTPDILQAIKKSFLELVPGVKLKLLLSFLYLPERTLQLWLEDLEEILEVAVADGDQWVALTAEFLQPFPRKGTVNLEPEENGLVLRETAAQLAAVEIRQPSLPVMEADYLGPAALEAHTGQPPACPSQQHFALRKATKAETLRKSLLERARDVANQVEKRTACGTPKSHRMSGGGPSAKNSSELSAREIFSTSSSSSSSRNGFSFSSGPPHVVKEGKIKFLDISELPATNDKESKRRRSQKAEEKADNQHLPNNAFYPSTFAGFEDPSNPTTYGQYTNGATPTYPAYHHHQLGMFQNYGQVFPPPPRPNQEHGGYSYPGCQPAFYGGPEPRMFFPLPGEPQGAYLQAPAMPQPRQPTAARRNAKRKFTYDPQEKMIEVLQLFRYANSASYKEKAFILSFIAGFRDNPCPELGPVCSIKVHEEREVFSQQDGSLLPLLGETLMQLNYDTGEVKTVKVYRSAVPQPSAEYHLQPPQPSTLI